MLTMVAFGVGEILGCIFIGKVVDRSNNRVAGLINLFVLVAMTALTLSFIAQY